MDKKMCSTRKRFSNTVVLVVVFTCGLFIGRLSHTSPNCPSITHKVAKLDHARQLLPPDKLKITNTEVKGQLDGPSPLDQDDPMRIGAESINDFLTIYDISKDDTPEKFFCLDMSIKPKTKVCLHDLRKDQTVSATLLKTGVWEREILLELKADLEQDPGIGLFDIGANIGVYSLFAAAMGRKVVAVEPYIENIHRFQRAAILGGSVERITLLQNAIADKRDRGTLQLSTFNQGLTSIIKNGKLCIGSSCPPTVKTILLSDLQYVASFDKAIIKMDIQGYEHLALTTIEGLLEEVDIKAIYMEWEFMRDMPESDIPKVIYFMKLLLRNGFRPRTLRHQNDLKLDPMKFRSWPFDMVWRR